MDQSEQTRVVELQGVHLAVTYSITYHEDMGTFLPVFTSIQATDGSYKPIGCNLMDMLDECYIKEGEILNPLLARLSYNIMMKSAH